MLLQVFAWFLSFALLIPLLGLVGFLAKRGSPGMILRGGTPSKVGDQLNKAAKAAEAPGTPPGKPPGFETVH